MPAPALPVIRVRIACRDEQEFTDRLAGSIAEKGFFVPTKNLRPLGTRVHLELELRDGRVAASGEAVVVGHAAPGARSGLTARFVRSDPGKPSAAADRYLELFGEEDLALESPPAPLELRVNKVKLQLKPTTPLPPATKRR